MLARKHQNTTFILAHWGARLPAHVHFGASIRAQRNVFYDTAASPLLYHSAVFHEIVSLVPERVLFGSDYPLVLYPKHELEPAVSSFVKEIRALGLSDEYTSAVLSGNARRLFKLV